MSSIGRVTSVAKAKLKDSFRALTVIAVHARHARPVAEAVTRWAERWITLVYNVDNDPARNGEYWLLTQFPADLGVVFDVGFNAGDFTKRALASFPTASVHAFDPDPGAADLARRLREPRLRFAPVALAADPGMREWCSLEPGNPSNSLGRTRREVKSSPTAGGPAEVLVDTLDRYCAAARVEVIDFLKIDAEGFDLEVLQGGAAMLSEQRVGLIMFEYGFGWLDAGKLLHDAISFLTERGYGVFRLLPTALAPILWKPQHENRLCGQFVALRAGHPLLRLVRDDLRL